eukprot:TRINITY_DN6109_c0_g1_i2.p2 TRINITY_DN6109_c0_g1~~TRINITY_DN6109_c0_g1_i2.p2  ORF type:complete len:162 (-),score=41.28 TRINITY_DN6109_c0_g1_i2:125-610(-)
MVSNLTHRLESCDEAAKQMEQPPDSGTSDSGPQPTHEQVTELKHKLERQTAEMAGLREELGSSSDAVEKAQCEIEAQREELAALQQEIARLEQAEQVMSWSPLLEATARITELEAALQAERDMVSNLTHRLESCDEAAKQMEQLPDSGTCLLYTSPSPRDS